MVKWRAWRKTSRIGKGDFVMGGEMKILQNGSDIRGIAISVKDGALRNLGAAEAFCLTRGFLEWLSEKTGKEIEGMKVAIGRDPRLSGKMLADAALFAMSASGVICYDCGLASTPAMFMSTVFPEFNCDGAIMVTASHLPPNRNGFKYFSGEGGVDKSDITNIIERAEAIMPHARGNSAVYPRLKIIEEKAGDLAAAVSGKAVEAGAGVPAAEALSPLMRVYCAHLRRVIRDKLGELGIHDELPLKNLKIVVDAGNGGGGFYAEHVLGRLGADTSGSQFLEPDGSFPNHAPNPENKAAMAAIRDCVIRNNADLGLIFDTDVDRASAVDEQGREIAGDGIVAMAAVIEGRGRPGATVVTDSVTGDGLTDFLEGNLGLKHFRYKRGYRNVINKAVELNNEGFDCPLAIETSGHAAARENYFLDDGAYLASCIVVEAVSQARAGKGISELIAGLRVPAASLEYRIPLRGIPPALPALAQDKSFGAAFDAAAAESGAPESLNLATGEEAVSSGSEPLADRILVELEEHARTRGVEIIKPSYEGVRLKFGAGQGDGWCLLRKSLHDPIMPLNIQSEQAGGEIKIRNFIFDFLKNYDGVDGEYLRNNKG